MASTQPSPAEWEEIDKRLKCVWLPVYLRVDGYLIQLELRQVGQFRNAITVFVNGWFRGQWILDKTEEARRFLPLRRTRLYKKRFAEEITRKLGKVSARKWLGVDKYSEHYGSCWTSYRSLKRHLLANNEHVDVITREEYEIGLQSARRTSVEEVQP